MVFANHIAKEPPQINIFVSDFLKEVQMNTDHHIAEPPIFEQILLLRNPQTNCFYRVVYDYANGRYGSQVFSGNNYHDKYWWYKNRMEHLYDDAYFIFCDEGFTEVLDIDSPELEDIFNDDESDDE